MDPNGGEKKAGSFRAGRSLLLEELLEVIEIACCDESLLMEVKSSQITNLTEHVGCQTNTFFSKKTRFAFLI